MNQESIARGRRVLDLFSLGVLGLLMVVPFLQYRHYYPLTDFYTEWTAFALGILALVSLVLRPPSFTPQDLLFPALILYVWVQYAAGRIVYREEAWLFVCYFSWAALLMLLGRGLAREFGREIPVTALAGFLAVGGVLSALTGLFQQYGTPYFLYPYVTPDAGPTIYGNLAQRNHLADYLSLSLASFIYLGQKFGKPKAVLLPALLLLFVLALTASRSAWLFLIALSALAYLHHRHDASGKSLLLWRMSMPLLPAFALMQGVAHYAGGRAGATSAERLVSLASGSSIRLDIWKEAWLSFLDNPLMGAGFGQFSWQHFVYAGLSMDPERVGLFTNAHDIFMQFLAETGVAGTVILLAGVFFWLFRTVKSEFTAERWWVYSLLAVMAIHSLLEYPLWYSQFLGVFALLLGLGEECGREFRPPRHFGVVVAAVLLLAGALLISTMKNYSRLEGLLYPDYHGGGGAKTERELEDSLRDLSRNWLLAPHAEVPLVGRMPLAGGDLRRKLELSSRVSRFSPVGMSAYRQAAFLAMKGDAAAAKVQLERAAVVNPELVEAFSLQLSEISNEPGIGKLIEELDAIRKRSAP